MTIEPQSKHFSKRELECRGPACCDHTAAIDPRLLVALDSIREEIRSSLYLSCAFRCIHHNRALNSLDSSQHVLGRAADVQAPHGVSVDRLAAIATATPNVRCVIKYDWGCHVDVRLGPTYYADKR